MTQIEQSPVRKIAVLINPIAGIGGSLGLKGSDEMPTEHYPQSWQDSRSNQRFARVLACLPSALVEAVEWLAGAGMGGQDCLQSFDLQCQALNNSESGGAQTRGWVEQALAAEVDLILFVGGDGTARDVCASAGSCPVLGVPAGVKMHSGVFAVSPDAAAPILEDFIQGRWLDIEQAEVRDIDEQAFRDGRVKSRLFGELWVPRKGQFLQRTKVSGREVEELVLADIAAEVVGRCYDADWLLLGPGTTVRAVAEELGVDNTLLGFDWVEQGKTVAADLDAAAIVKRLESASGEGLAVVTAIGGQGHVIGRGNQQLSPQALRLLTRDRLMVVATKTKLSELDGAPLIMDSNDPELDRAWEGPLRVITGYRDEVLYHLGSGIGSGNGPDTPSGSPQLE